MILQRISRLHRPERRRMWRFVLLLTAVLFGAVAAKADDLVSGLSTDLIQITSNFTGTDIVLFGDIEPTEEAGPAKDQDLVVVIRGPQIDMTVRRKERILGIWVNREQTVFTGLPGFYFLASTRPLDDIASLATQQRFRLGTANLETPVLGGMKPDEAAAFRAAAIRDRKRERLYWESPTGIEFLSRTLFRARIAIPAAVPPGEYRAEVYLFQNGTVVSAQSSPLYIDKSGFERRVYNYAYQASFAYGFAAVIMAFAFGWAGFLVFRER
jgi:uncharacterized protein (TIGR02186 family)